MTDEYYMRRAIALAQKGEGQVSPNPLVGAVIVKDGKIIGEGYHEHYGQPHAERNALANCPVHDMSQLSKYPTGYPQPIHLH